MSRPIRILEPPSSLSSSQPAGGGEEEDYAGAESTANRQPQFAMPQHYYDTTEGAALLLLGSTPSTLGSESLVGSMDQHAASAVAKPHSQHSLRSSNGSSGNILLSDDDDQEEGERDAATLGASTLAQHSDYTVQMSNRHRKQFPPPMNDVLLLHHQQRLVSSDNGNGIHNSNNNTNAPSTTQPSQGRRAIFGAGIQRKYGAPNRAAPVMDSNQPQIMWPHDNDDNLSNRSIPFYQTGAGGVLAPSSSIMSSPLMQKLHGGTGENNNSNYGSIEMENDNGNQQQHFDNNHTHPYNYNSSDHDDNNHRTESATTTQQQPPHHPEQAAAPLLVLEHPLSGVPAAPLSPLTSPTSSHRRVVNNETTTRHHDVSPTRHPHRPHRTNHHKHQPHHLHQSHTRVRVHETRHAQSLLLAAAFCAVWSPSNLLAPNLTAVAADFGFLEEKERDLYIGSYCALAVAVASLPVSALIGVYTDVVHSRKLLYCGTVLTGALACTATAYSQTYGQLLFCRWINGGCMAGSVPVAFSFLGDLFEASERNAASSGLTAMMGLGIIVGQVYAGSSFVNQWSDPFKVSGAVTTVLAVLCVFLVKDPERGGKEKVLQDMLRAGTRYERKLSWRGFYHAVRHNPSNFILLWQGFFSSLPWGVIFVFLNDFLSQERGFSVPDATFLVAVFGVGCAAGGILGGYFGQKVSALDRSYLPLFMAVTTVLGILPFMLLLNSHFTNAHGFKGLLCAGMGGLVASLPSVNVRPCLINVNPPESRGATLTAANLLINLGRGVGPSCITLIQSIGHVDRKFAFNVTMIAFWVISGFQLLLLMKTLPKDQDAMEAELASYAAQVISDAAQGGGGRRRDISMDSESLISIEDRITSFDGTAAKETFGFVRAGIQELRSPFHCVPDSVIEGGESNKSSSDSLSAYENGGAEEVAARRGLWLQQEAADMLAPSSISTIGDDTVNDISQWTDESLLMRELPRHDDPSETTPLVFL